MGLPPEYETDAIFKCTRCHDEYRRDRCGSSRGSIHCPTCRIKHTLVFTDRLDRFTKREAKMTERNGLPVHGYRPQSDDKIAVVNKNKELEERVLRQLDAMRAGGSAYDQSMVAIAFTGIQEAFMWMNRAVFQPTRASLPEDAPNDDGPTAA